MGKRSRIGVGLLASLLCVLLVAGIAYALAPSFDAAGEEVAAEEADSQKAVVEEAREQSFAEAYADEAQRLQLSGRDAQGNPIVQPSTIPSLLTAQAAGSAHYQTQVPLQASTQQSSAQGMMPMSLEIFDTVIPYVDSYGSSSAPAQTAGLWRGSDATQDGSWGYFIGHHPGVFNCVMYLEQGDTVQVCDRDGNARTYTVLEVYDVPDSTQWGQIASDVTSHGESITIQTCCGDDANYRIVEAA